MKAQLLVLAAKAFWLCLCHPMHGHVCVCVSAESRAKPRFTLGRAGRSCARWCRWPGAFFGCRHGAGAASKDPTLPMQILSPSPATCVAFQAMALLFPTVLWMLICSPPTLPLMNPAGSCKLFPTLQAVWCNQEVFARGNSSHVQLLQPHFPHNEEGEPAASPSARGWSSDKHLQAATGPKPSREDAEISSPLVGQLMLFLQLSAFSISPHLPLHAGPALYFLPSPGCRGGIASFACPPLANEITQGCSTIAQIENKAKGRGKKHGWDAAKTHPALGATPLGSKGPPQAAETTRWGLLG